MKKYHPVKGAKKAGMLAEVEDNLIKIYGTKLKKIILYGSYARGEEEKGSDLDVMALLDMDEAEIKGHSEQVLDLAVDLTTRYGVVISIQGNNITFFNEWVDTLPFFNNVIKEGVELYGG